MADNTDIALNVKVDGVEKSINSIKDLKDAIKAAKDEQIKAASAFGESSKEYQDAAKKVAALKDKVDDLNDSTQSLKGSGLERARQGFDQLGEGLKNLDFDKVKVGFTAMKTAMAAVGIGLIVQLVTYLIENFDRLSQGSGGVAKALRFVGDIIKQILEVGEQMLNWVTDLIGLTTEAERALEKQGNAIVESSKKTKAALEDQVKGFDNQIAAAKAAGKNTVDLEIAKQEAIIETNKQIAEQIIAFARSGGQLTEDQKKLFEESINNIKKAKEQENIIEITAQKEKNEKAKAASEKKAADDKALRDAQLADELRLIQQIEDAKLQSIQNEEQRASIKAALDKQKRDTEIENSKASEAIKQQALLASEQTFQDEMAKIYQSKIDKQKAADEKFEAEKKAKKEAELNEEVLKAELKVLQTEGDLQAELDLLTAKKNLAVEQAAGKESEIALIEEQYRQDKKAKEDADREEKRLKEEEERNRNFEAAQGALNSLQSLSDAYFAVKSANTKKGSAEEEKAARKQFDINKGIAIASATISGIQGVVNALSAQSVIPEPYGTILKVVTAVGIAASTVANISKISSTPFQTGGGGGGGGGAVTSVPTPAPPTINTPSANTNQSTTFDQTGKNLNQPTTQPTINVKATVGVDEVSDKQNRVSALETQSTF